MVLCVVLVQQGGVVPRHAGTRPDLRQTRQPRSQLLPPLPGPGAGGARVTGGQRGRSYEGEVPPDDMGEPGEQVEPEPTGAQGAEGEDPAAQARTGAAVPYAVGSAPDRERQGPGGEGGRGRDEEGGAEGQVQEAFGRCAGSDAVRDPPGPVGQARQARGGAGGEVAARGTGGEWGAGVCAGGVRGGAGASGACGVEAEAYGPGVRGSGACGSGACGSGACGSGVYGSGAYGFVAYGGGVRGSSGAGARRCCGRCCCCSRCLWVFLCWFFCRTRRCLAFRIAPARGSESDGVPVPVPADR